MEGGQKGPTNLNTFNWQIFHVASDRLLRFFAYPLYLT